MRILVHIRYLVIKLAIHEKPFKPKKRCRLNPSLGNCMSGVALTQQIRYIQVIVESCSSTQKDMQKCNYHNVISWKKRGFKIPKRRVSVPFRNIKKYQEGLLVNESQRSTSVKWETQCKQFFLVYRLARELAQQAIQIEKSTALIQVLTNMKIYQRRSHQRQLINSNNIDWITRTGLLQQLQRKLTTNTKTGGNAKREASSI